MLLMFVARFCHRLCYYAPNVTLLCVVSGEQHFHQVPLTAVSDADVSNRKGGNWQAGVIAT
jgi:hypothetical protein